MRPLVITIQSETTGEKHVRAFYRSPVHVGRNELNDLALPNEYVSLWHAVIRFEEEGIRYTDLGSKNGSEVGGRRISPNEAVDIAENEPLRIGDLRLELCRDEALAEAADREPAGTLFGSAGEGEQPPAESVSTRLFQLKDLAPKSREDATVIEPVPAPPPAPPRAPVKVQAFEPPRRPQPKAAPQTGERPKVSGADDLLRTAMPSYERFRDAWKALRLDLTHGLKSIPRAERSRALELVKAQMPQVLKEEEFQVMLNALGIASLRTLAAMTDGAAPAPPAPPPPRPAPQAEGAAHKLLVRFAKSYIPQAPPPESAEGEKLLERVADVLETCAKMFVEFRKGHGQFAEHMAVRAHEPETPLTAAKDGRDVLSYVLDWREPGRPRVDELKDGFKQFMVHEIALLQGLRAGVRELLDGLSPEKISGEAGASVLAAGARWRRYAELYEDLAEEQTLTRKLFGNAFWRAYTSVVEETE